VQGQFIDWPAEAVRTGDELVTRLVAERGYRPTISRSGSPTCRSSTPHAAQYREAHDIAERDRRGEATTEQLRQAMMPLPGALRRPDRTRQRRTQQP